MNYLKQSAAFNRTVLMTGTSDHITGAAGLTLTITASKNGGAFSSITPTVTDIGSGWYSLALTTTHTNTLGVLNLHITATGADPTDTQDQVVAFDPSDASLLGLTGVATAATQTTTTTTLGTINTQTNATNQQANVAAGLTTQGYSTARAALLANLDATVSSRGTSTYAGGAVASVTGNVGGNVTGSVGSVVSFGTLVSDIATAVWAATTRTLSAFSDSSGITTLLSRLSSGRATALDNLSNLDTTVSSRLATTGYTAPPAAPTVPTASENAVAVWASGTRSLTDKAGFSLSQAFPTNFSTLSINGSGAITTSNPATGGSSLTITDVQTALTNQGVTTTRAAYLDGISAAPPTAATIAAAVKAGSAASWYTAPDNTTITAIAGYIDTEVAAITTNVSAIKIKTDNLPGSPAAVGSAMTLTGAANNDIADALLDRTNGILTGVTPRQALRLFKAVMGGKRTYNPTTKTLVFMGPDGTTPALTQVIDGQGAVTSSVIGTL